MTCTRVKFFYRRGHADDIDVPIHRYRIDTLDVPASYRDVNLLDELFILREPQIRKYNSVAGPVGSERRDGYYGKTDGRYDGDDQGKR